MAAIMQLASLYLAGLAPSMKLLGPLIVIRLVEIISMIQMKSVMMVTTSVVMDAHKVVFKLKYLILALPLLSDLAIYIVVMENSKVTIRLLVKLMEFHQNNAMMETM